MPGSFKNMDKYKQDLIIAKRKLELMIISITKDLGGSDIFPRGGKKKQWEQKNWHDVFNKMKKELSENTKFNIADESKKTITELESEIEKMEVKVEKMQSDLEEWQQRQLSDLIKIGNLDDFLRDYRND